MKKKRNKVIAAGIGVVINIRGALSNLVVPWIASLLSLLLLLSLSPLVLQLQPAAARALSSLRLNWLRSSAELSRIFHKPCEKSYEGKFPDKKKTRTRENTRTTEGTRTTNRRKSFLQGLPRCFRDLRFSFHWRQQVATKTTRI